MLYKELMAQRNDPKFCPFCDGANKVVKETPLAYLTYALAPYTKHHLLIVPKRHVEMLHDVTRNEMDDILDLQHFGMGVLQLLGHHSVTALVRQGESTGRSVQHVHYHLIPEIRIGDLDHEGNERRVMDEKDVDALMEELKRAVTTQETKL